MAVAEATALFENGHAKEAMIACVDIARKDPLTPGLAALQGRILQSQAESRTRRAEILDSSTYARAAADVAELNLLPASYGLRRNIFVEPGSLRSLRSPMQEVLNRNVTVHMESVSLNDFILQIGESEGVNIIADGQLVDADATMTLHAEDIPLRELLEYASRNLGVTFSVGHNIIWATISDGSDTTVPLLTRMYRLRKGMTGTEMDGDSAQMRIVQAVSPPQILIEARFISVNVSDMRELGLDWLMTSDYTVREDDFNNTKTQVDSGASVGFTPFSAGAQGLNLTYRGLLTDPMFDATLHALESSGQARTLSVPKITTVNNSPAFLRVGEDFRYFEEYDVVSVPSAVTTGGAQQYSSVLVPVGTPQLEELGIELTVTPSVGSDMMSVTLKVVPEISEFVRYEFYEVGNRSSQSTGNANNNNNATATNNTSLVKIPIFRRSTLETEIVVQSGETVVMGGLVTAGERTSVERVPILSYIPLLGHLFRHDIIEKTQDNLLIFITASIISERGENLIPLTSASAEPSSTTPAGQAAAATPANE